MNIRHSRDRRKQLLRCIPDILDYKTLLYIGAKISRMQMLNLFIKASYEIDIIEIWPPYIEGLRKLKGIKRVLEGDIRYFSPLIYPLYDVIVWWHGPEHVYEREILKILDNLERTSKKLVIIASPWGMNRQGKAKGNIHQRHLTYLYPGFFEKIDWEVDTIGEKNEPGSNLLAWRRS